MLTPIYANVINFGNAGAAQCAQFFFSEFLAMAVLMIIGNGAVAAFELRHAKDGIDKPIGRPNFLFVGMGFGMAAFVGLLFTEFSDHQMNPASTFFNLIQTWGGMETIYTGHQWAALLAFAAEFSGAFVGQVILDVIFFVAMYDAHSPEAIIAFHSTTRPKPKSEKVKKSWTYAAGAIVETLSTFIMIITLVAPKFLTKNGDVASFFGNHVGFCAAAGIVVCIVVMSFGGVCGPGFNPARDLMPRTVYTILPLPNKTIKAAEWDYAAIPALCPFLGAALAGCVVLAVNALS